MRLSRFVFVGLALAYSFSQQVDFATAGVMFSYQQPQEVKMLTEVKYEEYKNNAVVQVVQVKFTDLDFDLDAEYEATLDYYDGDGFYNFISSGTFQISGFKLIGVDASTMAPLVANLEILANFGSDFRYKDGSNLAEAVNKPFRLIGNQNTPGQGIVDSVQIFDSGYYDGDAHFEHYVDELDREVEFGGGADYRIKNDPIPSIDELRQLRNSDFQAYQNYLDSLNKDSFLDRENKAFSAFTLRLARNQTDDLSRFVSEKLAFTVDWSLAPGSGGFDGFILSERITAPVPEPSSIAIFGLSALGVVVRGVRRKQNAQNA